MFGGTHPRTTSRALRLGIAAVGVGAALFGSTGTVAADPQDSPDDEVTGQVETQDEAIVEGTVVKGPGARIFTAEGSTIQTTEIVLQLNTGEEVLTYCIDIETPIDDGANYVEADWEGANPQSDLPRILWVLEHSIPNMSTADVLTEAGIESTGNPERDELIVYAGTQAAIWHFSDDAELGPQGAPRGGPADLSADEYKMVEDLHAFFTDTERNVGIDEPMPSLEITPTDITGTLGEPIGPFTVSTTAESIDVTVTEGAKVVDAAGNELTSVGNGDEIFVVSTTPETTVTLSGVAVIPTGRVFVDKDDPDSSQKLVLATPTEIQIEASITVTAEQAPPTTPPSPQPRPGLAETGATPWTKIGLGVLLVAGGAGLLLFGRTRTRGKGTTPAV